MHSGDAYNNTIKIVYAQSIIELGKQTLFYLFLFHIAKIGTTATTLLSSLDLEIYLFLGDVQFTSHMIEDIL